jgi:integral membrane sensor domain MASE1
MIIIGLLMSVVFYGMGKTDFESRAYWWTLSTVLGVCTLLTLIL